jgi:anti-sigma regulatory factor (Ser/Thr protein kinase)
MSAHTPNPIRLRPALEELERLTGYIAAFAEEQAVGARDLYALDLAAEELFANTIRHSRPQASFVEFSLRREDGLIAATYIDDGGFFDPTAHATPDTTLAAEHRPIGGLGVHFLQVSMEDLNYAREGERNVTRFRRRLAI